jgi:hypothetical protein
MGKFSSTSSRCGQVGFFFISLHNDFARTGASGGWPETDLTVTDIVDNPEPGTRIPFGTVFLIGASLGRRRVG